MDEPFGVFSSHEREMLKHVLVLYLRFSLVALLRQVPKLPVPKLLAASSSPIQPPSGTPIPAAQPLSAAIARSPIGSRFRLPLPSQAATKTITMATE
jgi:hypothetical protein